MKPKPTDLSLLMEIKGPCSILTCLLVGRIKTTATSRAEGVSRWGLFSPTVKTWNLTKKNQNTIFNFSMTGRSFGCMGQDVLYGSTEFGVWSKWLRKTCSKIKRRTKRAISALNWALIAMIENSVEQGWLGPGILDWQQQRVPFFKKGSNVSPPERKSSD